MAFSLLFVLFFAVDTNTFSVQFRSAELLP